NPPLILASRALQGRLSLNLHRSAPRSNHIFRGRLHIMAIHYWLMKAEPESRIVKGKDVKDRLRDDYVNLQFSVGDFESVKTTPWEGVRNAEARNLMKEMKIGDKVNVLSSLLTGISIQRLRAQVLFYHSNCKNPGKSLSTVSKEAYPDCEQPSDHPYFDPKTDQEKPKWYMVDVAFVARAKHFVPLSLLRNIAAAWEPPSEIAYIGEEGLKAIKGMALVSRGRLSVQKVEEKTWGVIEKLAERGGWEDTNKPKGKIDRKVVGEKKVRENADKADPELNQGGGNVEEGEVKSTSGVAGRKRKARVLEPDALATGLRRSTRSRK
ncbi:Thymocyte nuclear protein 1, partial [Grifola frondosa]